MSTLKECTCGHSLLNTEFTHIEKMNMVIKFYHIVCGYCGEHSEQFPTLEQAEKNWNDLITLLVDGSEAVEKETLPDIKQHFIKIKLMENIKNDTFATFDVKDHIFNRGTNTLDIKGMENTANELMFKILNSVEYETLIQLEIYVEEFSELSAAIVSVINAAIDFPEIDLTLVYYNKADRIYKQHIKSNHKIRRD